MPSDKIQPQKTTQDRQFYRSKNGLVVGRRQESGRTEMTANRYKNSFGKNKHYSEICITLRKDTNFLQNWVNYMVCKLYLNKINFKNSLITPIISNIRKHIHA